MPKPTRSMPECSGSSEGIDRERDRLSVQREIHRGDKEIRNKKGPIMSIDPFYCGTAVYRDFAFSCGGNTEMI